MLSLALLIVASFLSRLKKLANYASFRLQPPPRLRLPLLLLQVTSVKFVGEGDLVVTGSADKVILAHFECISISCLKLFSLSYLLPPCYACLFNLVCIW